MADAAPNPGPDRPMSRADYRSWAEAQPRGRYERVDGMVVAMAPERKRCSRNRFPPLPSVTCWQPVLPSFAKATC
jgi:Uma2 family endonuclease